MIRSLVGSQLFTLLLLGLVLATAGCEEEVAAPLAADEAFSLYGVINPRTDTQFVRVFPIEAVLAPYGPEPLDVSFVSTDLVSGEQRTWRDSVIAEGRSGYAHVYYAPFRAVYGHTYRLEVTGRGGASSRVEVDIPEETALKLGTTPPSYPVTITATLPGRVPNLLRSEAQFYVSYVIGYSPGTGTPIRSFVEHRVPYDDHVTKVTDGYRITFNISKAYDLVYEAVGGRDDYIAAEGIVLHLITFRTIVANEAWRPPDNSFDPLVLMQPGIMDNIENGFGFVGGGYRLQHTWSPPDEVIERTGFVPCCAGL